MEPIIRVCSTPQLVLENVMPCPIWFMKFTPRLSLLTWKGIFSGHPLQLQQKVNLSCQWHLRTLVVAKNYGLWFYYSLQEQLNGNLIIIPFQLAHIKKNLWIINWPQPTNLWPLTELRESLKHENREWQQFLGSLGSSDETLWPCLQPIFISFLTCVVTQTCIDPCRKMTSTAPI